MADERGSLPETLKYAQVGSMLIAPMLAFGAIGYFLDRRYATRPWLLLAGLIVGMIGGFVNFFRLVLPSKGGTKGGGGAGQGGGAG